MNLKSSISIFAIESSHADPDPWILIGLFPNPGGKKFSERLKYIHLEYRIVYLYIFYSTGIFVFIK